ncbi:MAG: PilN domain-containing protein [Pseudomonadota bacterium]
MKTPSQQINLYQDRFRKARVHFNAFQAIRLTLFVIVAMGVISVYNAYKTHQLNRQATNLQEQVETIQQQIAKLNQRNAAQGVTGNAASVSLMRQTRDERQRALLNLSQHSKQGGQLFSGYFEGLARRTLDGIWLNEISVHNEGRSLSLAGRTTDAALVPEWILGLKSEPAFIGLRFASAEIGANDHPVSGGQKRLGRTLHFALKTEYADEADKSQ